MGKVLNEHIIEVRNIDVKFLGYCEFCLLRKWQLYWRLFLRRLLFLIIVTESIALLRRLRLFRYCL